MPGQLFLASKVSITFAVLFVYFDDGKECLLLNKLRHTILEKICVGKLLVVFLFILSILLK